MDEKVRAHVWVSGVVQGVWFRGSTRTTADRLGLSGWVRNASDGRVEAVFEGSEGPVLQALDWVRRGPDMAVVEHVELEWEEYQGETGFRIR